MIGGVVHFFGRLSFLVDENAHAVHFFVHALLQLLDRRARAAPGTRRRGGRMRAPLVAVQRAHIDVLKCLEALLCSLTRLRARMRHRNVL